VNGSISEIIRHLIISTLDNAEGDFVVEHPADLSKGDYSTNVALVFAKILKKNPVELAKEIVEKISSKLPPEISKVETAGPGFINFFLSQEFFDQSVKEIADKGKDFGSSDILIGKKYFVEYTQPNPFKDFHIGHMMNNTIGETLARLFEKGGADVKRATYHGDVGIHVAKTIYGLQKENMEVSVTSMGKAYPLGNTAYEEDEQAKKEITDLNKKIYEKSDAVINALYEQGREVSLAYFETMYARLGSDFDFHFYESEAGAIGKEIVESFIGPVFEKSQGAVIFHGEDYGLHTRVFLNAEGLPTYEAKEVGLAQIKKDIFPYDLSLTITANEQDDFFRVVEVAIGKVFSELEGKLKHLSHGVLKLTTGKMSSRTGGVISAESFMDEVKESIVNKMNESDRNIPEGEKSAIAEMIALGAIKYWILRQSIGKDIVFDKEKALSLEGDSGPYLQYAHTRALSVLRKAKDAGIEADTTVEQNDLARKLYRLPEVIEESLSLQAPQQLVTYLTDLASTFNNFYAHNQILVENDPLSGKRVALVSAFAVVMKNGLETLGIGVPERM
jgi:arginyl-tRNA synthetase